MPHLDALETRLAEENADFGSQPGSSEWHLGLAEALIRAGRPVEAYGHQLLATEARANPEPDGSIG